MSILGSLVSFGLGSLSKRQDAKESRRSALNRLPYLRASAEAANFNPLTALMATGGAGFGSQGIASATPLASFSAIQGAVDEGVSFLSGETARDDERQRVQDRLQELRLEEAEAGGAGETSARTVGARGVGGNQPRLREEPDTALPDDPTGIGDTLATNPWGRSGATIWVDPVMPDAEHAEQRYGDVAQEAAGVRNLRQDSIYSEAMTVFQNQYGREAAQEVDRRRREAPHLPLQFIMDRVAERRGRLVRPVLRPTMETVFGNRERRDRRVNAADAWSEMSVAP